MLLQGKSSSSINAEVPESSINGPSPCLWYMNDLPNDVCNIPNTDMPLSALNVIRVLICGTV